MAVKYLLGFGLLLTYCFLEVSSRPNNESTKIEIPIEEVQEQKPDKEQRSISFIIDPSKDGFDDNTRDIIEKIKSINDGLKKPQTQQINYNKPLQPPESYVIDKETLEKIQALIASGKIKPGYYGTKQYEDNHLNDVSEENRREYSRAFQTHPQAFNQLSVPYPYITNMPVIVLPPPNNIHANNDLNSIQSRLNYQGRQEQPSPFPSFPSLSSFFPSNFQLPFQLPFQSTFQSPFQWPFASAFPFIIKDPFVALQQGGGWNNFFENGQSADVCARKQKSADSDVSKKSDDMNKILRLLASYEYNAKRDDEEEDSVEDEREETIDPVKIINSREARGMKKRTVENNAPAQKIDNPSKTENIETPRKAQKIYVAKPVVVTRKPPKKIYIEEEPEDYKTGAGDGDLRFPFGGFDWFGHKKPVAPSPGFFINKLRVRKGGVAIAGPGGVATAGKGGTAVVGPGGLAYTQPGGLAIAGPHARVIALSPGTDLSSVVTRLRGLNDMSLLQQPIEEGKASTQYLPFYGGAKGQYLEVKRDNSGAVLSEKIVAEENISGENVIKNSNGNLLSRVLAANLQNLKTLSTSLIRLNNLGRKLGYLNSNENAKFKNQLASLGETASNTVKLVEEIGDDLSVLFKNNATLRQYVDADDEDVGEEGISIENPNTDGDLQYATGLIAEAKPVGLAVVGDSGLAASRPMATAVAQSGVALARPVATAIAGLDPASLGILFNINHEERSTGKN